MSATLDIAPSQALAFRLARQHLLAPADDPLAAAGRLVGAQAQVHSAAVLQLRARSRDATAEGVRSALFQKRSLVKLWGQRGTLHILPTADLPLILALRRAVLDGYRRWYANGGLSPEQIAQLVEAIPLALADGPASRTDLADRLSPQLGDWARPWLAHSWGGAIKMAAALGSVCHGPERDREATFLRLDHWVSVPPFDERAARAVLLRRYLAAFGPAAPRDFAKFSGLPAPTVREAFEAVRGELVAMSLAGRPVWALAADETAVRTAAMPPGEITVLPLFDPHLLAHADTSLMVPPRHRSRIYRTAGWITAVILREGRLAGTWSYERRGAGWAVTVTPLGRLGARPFRRIEARLRHLAAAFGIAEVTVTTADATSDGEAAPALPSARKTVRV